jgi:hypothetical protein
MTDSPTQSVFRSHRWLQPVGIGVGAFIWSGALLESTGLGIAVGLVGWTLSTLVIPFSVDLFRDRVELRLGPFGILRDRIAAEDLWLSQRSMQIKFGRVSGGRVGLFRTVRIMNQPLRPSDSLVTEMERTYPSLRRA